MCGIAGYIGTRRISDESVQRCLARMQRRGPDASGSRRFTDRGKDLISRQKGQFAAAIEAGKQGYREAKKADSGKPSAAVEES